MTMPEPHLDDAALSALIDSDSPDAGGATAHLDACAACLDRFAALQLAAVAVGTPVVPLSAGSIDDLVARAVRDGARDAPVDISRARASRRRWRSPSPALLGAVAAVVMLLLAVPIVLSNAGNRDKSSLNTAARDLPAGAGAETSGGGGAATGRSAADSLSEAVVAGDTTAALSGENLGGVASTDDLRRILIARLSTGVSTAPAASGTGTSNYESGDTAKAAPAALSCTEAAREVGAGRLGAQTYAAFVQWKGERAQVVVFQLVEPASDGERQAYVMRTDGCGVLAETRF